MPSPRSMLTLITSITVLMLTADPLTADPLTVDDALRRARAQYPLTRQADVIARSAAYSVDNVYRGYYPQVSITAQATYQSDVTAVPINLPTMTITPMSKDQYRVQAEVSQTIFDGGVMAHQSSVAQATADVQSAQLEVELYRLRDRVQQLMAGAVLLTDHLAQVRTKMADVTTALSALRGAVDAGAALRQQVDLLDAELLGARQREAQLMADRQAYLAMLTMLTGTTVDTTTVLVLPDTLATIDELHRPELPMFDAQHRAIDARSDAISARSLPKFTAFVQGGYGRPGLNMLRNAFDTYYIAGVRMAWPLTDLYASAAERQLLDMERQAVDVQRSTFDFNTRLALAQLRQQIDAMDALLSLDDQIIAKRTAVRDVSKAQLDHGTITAHDYMRDVNALDMAHRDRSLHRVQRALALMNYASTSGN